MSNYRMICRIGLLAFTAMAGVAGAQNTINRVGQGVQPLAAPNLPTPAANGPATPPPTIHMPGTPAAMPTPLPGGPLPAPIDLKQEAIDRTAPLTPKEIIELRQELDRRSAAMTQPLDPVGKPVRRFLALDLTPGAPPEIIRAAFSQGTVISFVDAAGRPWPVVIADNFNKAGFDILPFGTNGVSIGVKSPQARSGNLAVLLEGMTTPVPFSVVTNQREVDYSVEIQLRRYLPGLPEPVGSVQQIRSLGASDLMNFLLNTPPREARILQSDSPNVKAWQISAERMIVRTDAMVASPAWQRRQSSDTGVSVYDLPLTSRVLVASQGQLMTVRVSGFAATKEQK